MARNKGKSCYYCGAPADSVEHVPPKQMFKGFDCDSITVPSCKIHNTRKSGNDQAIVSAFVIPLYSSRNRYPQETEIKKAIEHALPSFVKAKRRALNLALLNDPPEAFSDLPNVSYIMPSVNIRAWIKQLSAALIFDAIQELDSNINWSEVIVESPDWIETDSPSPLPVEHVISVLQQKGEAKAQLESLLWHKGWSAHPRAYPAIIYQFHLHFQTDELIFRHRFYNRYTWYVQIPAIADTTLNGLLVKAKSRGV